MLFALSSFSPLEQAELVLEKIHGSQDYGSELSSIQSAQVAYKVRLEPEYVGNKYHSHFFTHTHICTHGHTHTCQHTHTCTHTHTHAGMQIHTPFTTHTHTSFLSF